MASRYYLSKLYGFPPCRTGGADKTGRRDVISFFLFLYAIFCKDTTKREKRQIYLHFSEREYLRPSGQSTIKRGIYQIYLSKSERKYLRVLAQSTIKRKGKYRVCLSIRFRQRMLIRYYFILIQLILNKIGAIIWWYKEKRRNFVLVHWCTFKIWKKKRYYPIIVI